MMAANVVSGLPANPVAASAYSHIRNVTVFPNGTWIENIAVRWNGNLLVTLLNRPEVWEVEPLTGHSELVYSFPEATGTLGIAEIEHDVFAVNVGNSTLPATGVPGTWSIWTLDYNAGRPAKTSGGLSKTPAGKKVAAIPAAVFLNGLAALPTLPGVVLTADSFLGQVLAVDTKKGNWSVAIDLPELKANLTAVAQLGVNGLHIRDKHLYFTNSFKSPVLAKIPLSRDGHAAGPVQTIINSPQYQALVGYYADDFALDARLEYAWLTTDPSNVVVKISLATDKQQVVAGAASDPTVAGATSAAFGRRWEDIHTLYIVTNGGLANPSSAGVTGGKIVALNTDYYY
ncbi:hypothetical protein NQ176_g7511 [Zarea fungicola]|uniref:Uncharacterized protein n=1 Tax=Zarea fungicola TaxID=93591 RepID=A0ACC1MZ43_9HYPO|nr:hypothetical protein NQ176_g7511 [Lecanicillium fungicola]